MNNLLATHFRVYFEMSAGAAALLAGAFGFMNVFARSLGGMLSDAAFAKFGFRGRLWSQFFALLFEGIMFHSFASVTSSQNWYSLLVVLVPFSIFVQIAEGTSFGIVPFINKEKLAISAAIVGAGGSAGAVFASVAFYDRDWEDTLIPFKLHAEFVLFMALLTPLYHWPEYGSMFSAPSIAQSSAIRETKSVQDRSPAVGSMALLQAQQQSQDRQPELFSGDYLDMVTKPSRNPSRFMPKPPKKAKASVISPREIGASSPQGSCETFKSELASNASTHRRSDHPLVSRC